MEKFRFKKNLGQNFLQDEKILQKIVESVMCTEDDCIVEIGPGHGALTKYLVKYNCPVIAFEIDKEVKPVLDRIKVPNLRVVYEDFMKVNVKEYLPDNYKNLYIIANIPYYITTPILEKIIAENLNEKSCTLMVQKEVADRFGAKPGSKDYGSISVYLDYYYQVKKLFEVPRKAFYPVPNVDSAIIKLDRKDKKDLADEDKFFKFVKSAFQFKRKNLRNNLKNYDLEKINSVLVKYNHNLQNRAEEISLKEFLDIYAVLFPNEI